MVRDLSDFITSDIVTDHENQFALPDLLKCDYFKRHKEGYYAAREAGCLNRYRNYVTLLEDLNDIRAYNEQHAKSYAKRFREGSEDWRNCEAIFSEVIVYRAYIRGVYEGLIRSIHLEEAESDIIVERLDGSKMFLEVFCVMPSFPLPDEDGKPKVYSVRTHTQTEIASIRQKLLRKISKQSQLSKPRENFAVIELNDVSIAGDFAVLSSLSGGYKLKLGLESGKVLSRGYDWDNSVFDDPSTQWLKGVIYFSLGDYESRKFIFNPMFSSQFTQNPSPSP
jgi:CRP-like cAMP-binding protein